MEITRINWYSETAVRQSVQKLTASYPTTFRVLAETARKLTGTPGVGTQARHESGEGVSNDSLFAYWANTMPSPGVRGIDGGDGTFDATGENMSRYCRMMHDYQEWKARWPTTDALAASASDEEWTAWLETQYGDEPGAFELLDAIETLFQSGAISRQEHNAIYGTQLIRVTKKEMEYISSRAFVAPAGWSNSWHDGFEKAPLMEFRSISDIFDWLADFRGRRTEYPETISYAKAKLLGHVL